MWEGDNEVSRIVDKKMMLMLIIGATVKVRKLLIDFDAGMNLNKT